MKTLSKRDSAIEKMGWVLIPPTVMTRNDLSLIEKVLIGRVKGLMNERGYCFASNKWLGQQLGKSAKRISSLLSSLRSKGIINIELIRDEKKRIVERRIIPIADEGGILKNGDTYTQKCGEGILKNAEGSNREESNKERVLKTYTCDSDLTGKEKLFEDFWKNFPPRKGKKLNKTDAKSLFIKFNFESIEQILQAVKNYADSTSVKAGFAKDAIRFLKNDYWQDWLEPENADADRLSFLRKRRQNGEDADGRPLDIAGNPYRDELFKHRLALGERFDSREKASGGAV